MTKEANLKVLILVFVEFTLRDIQIMIDEKDINGLNPCFCGIYSQSMGSVI